MLAIYISTIIQLWVAFDNNYYLSVDKSDSNILLQSPTSQAKCGDFSSFCDEFVHQGDATGGGGVGNVVKMLNHSERDRRKKINDMYSTLRSLLLPQDQFSKLSIPATISRVFKYIPIDLQNEVERLEDKKERYMPRFSRQQESYEDVQGDQKRAKYSHDGVISTSSSSVISATQISSREVMIQISVPKVEKTSVSQALVVLEQQGCNLHSIISRKDFL